MTNCIIIDDDPLMRKILKDMIQKHPELQFNEEFSEPIMALEYLKKNSVQLIFLDIEMPNMTGLEFIETFENQLPEIIITTSHESFATKAFEYNVSGYLVKPIKPAEFHKAVQKVLKNNGEEVQTHSNSDIFFVKKGATIKRVSTKDVTMIECIGDYVNIYTDTEKYTIHSTMKAIENRFDANEFIRVHRSYIVRFDKIEEIEDDSISFGKKIVPIGKTYRQEVFSKFKML